MRTDVDPLNGCGHLDFFVHTFVFIHLIYELYAKRTYVEYQGKSL